MKKLSNILATIIVVLFLLSFGMKSEAVGQPCTQIKDTLLIDSCEYEVSMCVYCAAAYPGYIEVDTLRQLGSCSSTLDPNELVQQAELQASASLWYDYCQTNMPPCNGMERETMKVKMYICWRARLEYASIAKENRYVYYPCNINEYCEVEYKFCADSLGVLHTTISSVTPNFPSDSTLSCFDSEGSDLVLPKGQSNNGQESACYILHTPCNLDGFIWDLP